VLGVTPLPDPERWLKKSERSTFGAGGKRKKGGGATQGAVEGVAPASGGKGGGKGKKKK
jgi:signal recognition particle subunit SRP72